MAPPVLTELLSDPGISSEVSRLYASYRLSRSSLDFGSELVHLARRFWQSAARLGDALIAQSCLDAGIPALTRDRDFGAFAGTVGLTLLVDSSRSRV